MVTAQLVLAARVLMAVVLAVAACGKGASRRRLEAFTTSLRGWGSPPLGTWRPIALTVVAVEAAVAALVAVPVTARAGLVSAAALLGVFAVAVAVSVVRRRQVRCQCFGSDGATLGVRHVARNVVLATVAVTAAAADAVDHADALPLAGAAASVALGAFVAYLVIHIDDLVGALAPSTSPGH